MQSALNLFGEGKAEKYILTTAINVGLTVVP